MIFHANANTFEFVPGHALNLMPVLIPHLPSSPHRLRACRERAKSVLCPSLFFTILKSAELNTGQEGLHTGRSPSAGQGRAGHHT